MYRIPHREELPKSFHLQVTEIELGVLAVLDTSQHCGMPICNGSQVLMALYGCQEFIYQERNPLMLQLSLRMEAPSWVLR